MMQAATAEIKQNDSRRTQRMRANPDVSTFDHFGGFSVSSGRQRFAQMQRAVGNQAVLRMLGANGVQAKFTISEPSDRYEQEADRAAELVMKADSTMAEDLTNLSPVINRACEDCVTEEVVHSEQRLYRQVIDDDQNSASTEIDEIDAGSSEDYIVPDETGMPKRESGRQTPTRGSFKVPEGQGEPLRPETRLRMESQFGHNFEWVTIHTGSDAALSARQIGAHAYTIGGSIFFNEGQYQPETGEGQKLIAHELAHVIQQTSGLLRQVDNQLDSQSNNNPNTNIETTDAGIDNVTGMVTSQPAKKGGRGNVCSSGSCPQGKRKQAVRNDCQSSGPVDQSNFIDQLTVSLSGQTVDVHWSGGKIESWPCSPRPSVTPKGSDVVGTKCSIKHTNRSRDGMAWFTGFSSQGLRIGFHDSQRVGTGIFSHGCVRVCCDKAEIINQNTWSGKTAINVS